MTKGDWVSSFGLRNSGFLGHWWVIGHWSFVPNPRSAPQFHHASRAVALVDGADQFDGASAFAAIDLGRAVGADRIHEIRQLAAMALVADRFGVRGATTRSDLRREPPLHFVVGGSRRREVPLQHVLLLDHRRAALAVDGDLLRLAGVNAGRADEHAEGTGF